MIAIIGASGSGKDTLVNTFTESHPEYKKVILYTTRPIREGESDGVDYRFVSEKHFEKLVKKKFFAWCEEYKGWYYGVPEEECKLDNCMAVLTPATFRALKKRGFKVDSVYLYVDRRSRLMSILKRGDDVDEAYRRNLTEVGQFDGFSFDADYIISNTGFHMNPDEATKCLEEVIDRIKSEKEDMANDPEDNSR